MYYIICLANMCLKLPGLSWEIDNAGFMRNAFVNGTGLQNRTDDNSNVDPRYVYYGNRVIFVLMRTPYSTDEGLGISVDIGTIQPGTESNPVIYTIGVVRDPVIQYTNGNNELEERRAYYWANFTSINDVVCLFSRLNTPFI